MLCRKITQGRLGRECHDGGYCFIWVVRVGFTAKVTFEERLTASEEASHAAMCGRSCQAEGTVCWAYVSC